MATMLAILLGTSCARGCNGDEGRTGHIETRVFVECDPDGYTIRNDGEEARHVIASGFCVLNSAQIEGLGPHGEIEDMVVHGSGLAEVAPFSGIVEAGGEASGTYDLSKVSPCMDYTHAPPGQHEMSPTPLTSAGPADAMLIHLHVSKITAMRIENEVRVVCRW